MAVNCKFGVRPTLSNYNYYCEVKNRDIFIESTFEGKHRNGKSDKDVKNVFINLCRMTQIPQSLGLTFRSTTNLYVNNSNLKSLTKFDLMHFENLERIHVIGNDIEFLPSDLFEFTKHVKFIQFGKNNIKFIGPKILDSLDDLRTVSFSANVSINCWYYDGKLPNNAVTLEQLKEIIRTDCGPPMNEREMLRKIGRDPDDGNAIKKKPTKNSIYNFQDDLKKLSKLDDFKDFTIKVADKEFKAHKFVFAARSQTFADAIKVNLNADFLELHDIPVKVFECILSFVYTDKLPETENIHEIFDAAGTLKIRGLMDLTEDLLTSSIEKEKNLEILHKIFDSASKFDREVLKSKASEAITKHFEEKKLKDELENQLLDTIKVERC